MRILAKTDKGRVRKENQDSYSFFSADDAKVLIVADGLGGHQGGKRASTLACETIMARIKEEYKASLSDSAVLSLLQQSFNEANSVIWHYSVKEPENRGMGTTIVLCFIRGGNYIILNLGDSRAYMIGDEINQITVDQSYVQSLVDKGEITKLEARNYPGKSVILQAAGVGDSILPDVYRGRAEGNILLCSDGLTNELTDEEIFNIVAGVGSESSTGGEESDENAKYDEILNKLIDAANGNGGMDNITAVIAFTERRVK